jgi:centractin
LLCHSPSLDSAVVIDTGSTFIRAGYSGDDFPTVVFPACLEYVEQFTANGIKPSSGLLGTPEMENSYYQLRGKFGPYHPKKNMDVDDMERIWEHMYANELRVVSEDYGVSAHFF